MKTLRPYTYLGTVQGMCRGCREIVPCRVVEDAGAVFQERLCPKCGSTRARLADSLEWYLERTRTPVACRPYRGTTDPVKRGCPHDCGPCAAHANTCHLPVFSITNGAGGVFQAFFELVGPGDVTNKATKASPPMAAPMGPRYLTPQNRVPAPVTPGGKVGGVPGGVVRPARIDPATGLPLAPGAAAPTGRIDPATGLPTTYVPPFPLPAPGTNI